jgi:hypothetical protein
MSTSAASSATSNAIRPVADCPGSAPASVEKRERVGGVDTSASTRAGLSGGRGAAYYGPSMNRATHLRDRHIVGWHRLRVIRLLVAAAVSAAAARTVYEVTLGDVNTAAWRFDGIDLASASVLLFLLAPPTVYLAVRRRESVLRYAIGMLAVPLLALQIGLAPENTKNRRWQLEARETFAAHTQRFAPGRLHDRFVAEQLFNTVVVCAKDRTKDPNARKWSTPGFCAFSSRYETNQRKTWSDGVPVIDPVRGAPSPALAS